MTGSIAGYSTILHPNKIVGTHENWFLEGVSLAYGHLSTLTIVSEHDVMDADSFLWRKKFDGHPEYNRMETDLSVDTKSSIYFQEDY